ncbi:MAG: H-NS histone family protein [Burkholderiales bacterium]|uniref:DNA-binding protein n=1 Tax=Pandoraea thiooxydans TaxID=445709 RepID=A0A0G3EQQ2_9BURK|nr:H-NS histone family protein [Pandoraea thiooxydans]MBU6494396.1 H-NS histone family protein [Burkholderiales bacterium]AKJ67011.1 DNA-binding protein [Pandoraea thiooxydans]APR93924.1 h-ns histone-like nucleoid-structuring protein [Pandoraea thiooxydans]MDE2288469.1 H-NS histone family protein [Burkholderiales bacterium]MDE2609071.1 H-NS histone family protein [Burkholderiales bacterium]
MPSYKELIAQREKIEKQIEEARAKEVAAVIADIKQKIEEYELTAKDLGLSVERKQRRASKGPVVAKYMNPATGETWSGRGRAPKWIGRNREKFLIE